LNELQKMGGPPTPYEIIVVCTNTNVKVRYETYEEVRAALLEEGINVDQLPMLEDMRPPEERN
jgi:hypothetical protein